MEPDLTTNCVNQKILRQVFRDWHSLKQLGQNPLVSLKIVEACRQESGFAHNAQGKGLTLQKVIHAAVETLVPDSGAPNPHERRWRPYIILTEQFFRSQSPEVIRQQLFVSKGTYYEEQNRALEMVIAALEKQEHEFAAQISPFTDQQRPVPLMAPPRTGDRLVGREGCFREIKTALFQGEGRAVAALRGLPGVGKTALAVELAYDPEIQQYFNDGILWAGLGRQPSPLTLLSTWAEALGIPPHTVDGRASLGERAALLRAEIGLRRMLLIIDDAWQVESALALKVGGPNCAHLITTRLPDVALAFAAGNVIQVHELGAEDGLNLLEQISPHVVAADRDQAQKLVQAVGSLPLALILMGKYLQKQSDSLQVRRVHEALQKLQTAEVRLRLDHLQSPLESHPNFPFGTPLSLQAAIGLSDASLDPPAHAALVDLGCFPPKPSSFSEAAALAVTTACPQTLDALVDGGLLETIAPDRYAFHQTITDYAALQQTGTAASERFIAFYTALVESGVQDFNLLDREITNIFAASTLALDFGQQEGFVRLVLALYPFLETRGWYEIAERYLQKACTVANEMDDRFGQAAALGKLGDFEVRRGHFKAAQHLLEQSLALAREAGIQLIEGENLFNLGLACAYQGEVGEAWRYLKQCLRLYRETHNEIGEVYALNALGFALQEAGRYSEAKTYLDDALQRSVKISEQRNEGWAHYNLSQVYFSTGDYAQAKDNAEQCLQIYRALGDRRGEGWIIFEKGRVLRQTGAYDQADRLFSQALQILSILGDTMGEGYSLLNLGLIKMDLGYPDEAEAYYNQALRKFIQIECRTGESQAYHLLGNLSRKNGDFLAARGWLEKSLQIYNILPYKRGQCTHLAQLALVEAHLDCPEAALKHVDEALRIADEMQALPTRAYVLTCLGQTLMENSRLMPAEAAFRQALSLDQQLGQNHLMIEPMAGLAAIALAAGDLTQAKSWVDEILVAIEKQTGLVKDSAFLLRTDRPAQVFLTCYRVLNAVQDQRAVSVLGSGARWMQAWAARLASESQKSAFLNLPEHREIQEKLGQGEGAHR